LYLTIKFKTMEQNANPTPKATKTNPEVLKIHFDGIINSSKMASLALSAEIPEKLEEQMEMIIKHHANILRLTEK